MISLLILVYLLNFIVVLPGCILTWVFGALIKREIKYLFLMLAAACTLACIASFLLRYQNNAYSTTIAVLGAMAVIPSMCTAIHTYKKEKKCENPEEKPENSSNIVSETQEKEPNYIQEIKGLKELLDSGAITQAEYDKKKTEILDRKL